MPNSSQKFSEWKTFSDTASVIENTMPINKTSTIKLKIFFFFIYLSPRIFVPFHKSCDVFFANVILIVCQKV